MSTLADLFESNAASSWEKQEHFFELIGNHEWELDFQKGEIVFNKTHKFSIQILGREQENTWTWSWANEEEFSRELTHAALNLRELGFQLGIDELVMARLRVDEINGSYLSLIASAICKANAFYRISLNEGSLLVLLYNKNLTSSIKVASTSHQLVKTFSNLTCQFEMNHRKALVSYLKTNGYSCSANTKILEAVSRGGGKIYATFDNQDRLHEVSAK